MANVVIVGAQWGDEGKGKIVDWLCEKADVVVRFQGGHNAGHTLVIDGNIYKLSLLPSGLVRGKLSIIGNGVVIDPHALLREIDIVSSQGVEITPERLKIADNASLILSLHRELDALREAQARGTRIGTTKSGIGPAYEDKVGRRAIRMCDLTNLNSLPEKIDRLLSHHNPLRAGLGQPLLSADKLYEELAVTAEPVTSYMAKIWQVLDQQWRDGRRILFEGAQGAMLDIDYGTYPFVTSSNTLAGQVACGSGVGPHMINKVLGIVKAYSTRVGAGPFPTEQENEIGQRLGERGKEFGTVTGRRRRCGWFDAVLARQSVVVNGISAIALTKLDVLDGLDELMVCTAYELDGVQLDTLPTTQEAQARVKPVYKSFAGWRQSTRGARRWADLPAEAIKYIRQIEELVGAPVALLSTSPERDDTILVSDPFIN